MLLKLRRLIAILLVAWLPAFAQQQIQLGPDTPVQVKGVIQPANHYVYIGALGGLPATCAVGEAAFVTGVSPGKNDYRCTATNTWTVQGNANTNGLGNGTTVIDASTKTSGSLTGGIQEAINAWTAPACGTVIIPGPVTASVTINVANRYGCQLIGIGPGLNSTSSLSSIKWTGAADSTVLSFSDCVKCRAADFLIDGNNLAGIGLANTSATGSSQTNLFENLTILNITGTPGDAIYTGSATDRQVDTATYRSVTTNNSVTGIYQEGVNTLQILYEKMNIQDITSHYVDLEGGGMTSENSLYVGTLGSNLNLFQISNAAAYASFLNDYWEGAPTTSTIFNMVGALNANGPVVTIQNGQYNVSTTGNTWINYTQNGQLSLIANRWSSVSGNAVNFSPLGTVGLSYFGHLSLINNKWINAPTFTLTQPLSVLGFDPDVVASYGLIPFQSSFQESITGTNFQFIKSPLSLYDGSTRYDLTVGSTGLQVYGGGNLIGGFNVGSPSGLSAGSFSVPTIDATTINNGDTSATAQSGSLREPNGGALNFRNNAGSGDINGLSKNSSDIVVVGGLPGVSIPGPVTSGNLQPTSVIVNQLSPPTTLPAQSGSIPTGGTLSATTTYCYYITALDGVGGETVVSSQLCETTGSGPNTYETVTAWYPVAGAAGYNIYGRTNASELLMTPSPILPSSQIFTVPYGFIFQFTDTGSVTPSGAKPTINTTGSIAAASVSSGGSNVVYRCATSGALPAGALTIVGGSCGTTTDTGLKVQ